MFIAMAVVLSMFLIAFTGCATSSNVSGAKQESSKKDSAKKSVKYDQKRAMDEESMNAVR
ncbi:MAG TPA: hypothetical protein VLA67_02160 [Nitrospiraceae bacterium]|nr:hypothetical protein [Nitrospiraceae bacterium]